MLWSPKLVTLHREIMISIALGHLWYECTVTHSPVFVCCSRTILLSVISLLNEPNTFSPANVDASVMFRKWIDSKGKDKEYAEIIR